MRRADSEFVRQWFSEWLSDPTTFGPASERLANLITGDPEAAWSLILLLVASAPSESGLECVAAGPLEDLVCAHGRQFIDRAEAAARESPRFKRALGIVWGHFRMDPDIRERVTRAARAATEP